MYIYSSVEAVNANDVVRRRGDHFVTMRMCSCVCMWVCLCVC